MRGPAFTYAAKSDFQGQDTFAIAVSGSINKRRGSSTIHVTVLVDAEPTRVHTQGRDNLAAQVTNTRTPSITTTPGFGETNANSGEGPPPGQVAGCDGLAPEGNFEEITPPDVKAGLGTKRADGQVRGGTFAIAVDPLNHGTVYAGTLFQKVWKSTDCGTTWKVIATGANAANVNGGIEHGSNRRGSSERRHNSLR